MFIVLQLTIGYEVDAAIRSLVENHDWYIMPVINPDGYEYTWTAVSCFLQIIFRHLWVFQVFGEFFGLVFKFEYFNIKVNVRI